MLNRSKKLITQLEQVSPLINRGRLHQTGELLIVLVQYMQRNHSTLVKCYCKQLWVHVCFVYALDRNIHKWVSQLLINEDIPFVW